MFKNRSNEPERIDTGDYTPEEYRRFLSEIAFINRHFGERRAVKKTLLAEIEAANLGEFSVLDVGSGSGELLTIIADFAKGANRKARLAGIDLNLQSVETTNARSHEFAEIAAVQGDALTLPFADDSFDYAISSLFFHHLTDERIVTALCEMARVARRGIFVIDLHRHPMAYLLYKIFCIAYRISPLVRHDGSLSILKGFKSAELKEIGETAQLSRPTVKRYFPFRVVLTGT